MSVSIDPKVLDDLVAAYGKMNRVDIVHCWNNATLHWNIAPQYRGENEPAHIRSARTLFVHARWADNEEMREAFRYAAELLIYGYRNS